MAATRLIFARHGKTASNKAGRGVHMSGWTDVPLSPLGERQTHALEQRLIAELPGVPIYASPLQRAARAAHAVARATGAPLVIMDDLREINCGLADGVRIEEVQRRYPDAWAANERQEDESFRWPAGESYREFRERSLRAVTHVAAAHAGGMALLITHAGVISEVIGAIYGVSPALWSCFRPANASLTEICWEGEKGKLKVYDDRLHLESL